MSRRIAKSPETHGFSSPSHSRDLVSRDGTIELGISRVPLLLLSPLSPSLDITAFIPLPPGPAPRLPDVRVGTVLLHDIHKGIPRDVLGDEAHDLPRVVLEARHDEVADEQAALSDAVGREAQVADLGAHGADALAGGGGVVVGLEEAARGGARPELEVGQVDVDEAVEQRERGRRVEGRRVVDDGDAQAQGPRVQDREDHLRHHVLRRHEVDVVHAADLLQLHVPLAQRLGRQVEPVALVRDRVVLAERAPQVAA